MHSPAVAVELRARGLDAIAVKERPDLVGRSDSDLFTVAVDEDLVIVTENVKDFAALHQQSTARGELAAGLVFTHSGRFSRAARSYVSTLSQALAAFLAEHGPGLDDTESFVWWLERAA